MMDRLWDWNDPTIYWVECRRCDAKASEQDSERSAAYWWNMREGLDGE
jgi:hypothetical protein